MKQIARLSCFFILCLLFLIIALFLFPFLTSQRTRGRVNTLGTQLWARLLLRLIGIKVIAHGFNPEYRKSHYLLVGNHQSYLDIAIIASVFPAIFVAKREVRKWPIIGLLAKLGGTIFVNREDTRDNVSGAYRVSRSLRSGSSVQVFPESITSDGTQVLPFKALFFASAIRAGAEILPLTINFRKVNGQALDNGTRDALCWYGEMEFLPHFWNLLKIDSAEVSLMFHQPIKGSRKYGAEAIARRVQNAVSNGFDYDIASAIEAARAEVPVEFAAAHELSQTTELTENEDDRQADFIIGALLHSLFAPKEIEIAEKHQTRSSVNETNQYNEG